MKPYTVHFSTQSLLQVKNKYNVKVQLTSELIFQSELLHLGHACSGEESGEVGTSKTGNLRTVDVNKRSYKVSAGHLRGPNHS